MRLDARAFALAAGAAAAILFTLCALAVAIAPDPTTAFFGYLVHVDLSGLARTLTFGSFVGGLLAWTVGTALTFGLAGTIYNRLIRPASAVQAAAPPRAATQRGRARWRMAPCGMKRPLRWLVGFGVLAAATGCSGDSLTPSSTTALLEVTPSGGAADVAPDGGITIRFSGPMGPGMEQYVDLHQGTINGPVVPMSCTWSAERTTLTCLPSPPLQGQSPYALHVGTGMMDADGHGVVMEDPGVRMGGERVTSGMMAGMHAGQPVNAMGPGWRNVEGHFGLAFGFTTR